MWTVIYEFSGTRAFLLEGQPERVLEELEDYDSTTDRGAIVCPTNRMVASHVQN